jgi:hypothetical protein
VGAGDTSEPPTYPAHAPRHPLPARSGFRGLTVADASEAALALGRARAVAAGRAIKFERADVVAGLAPKYSYHAIIDKVRPPPPPPCGALGLPSLGPPVAVADGRCAHARRLPTRRPARAERGEQGARVGAHRAGLRPERALPLMPSPAPPPAPARGRSTASCAAAAAQARPTRARRCATCTPRCAARAPWWWSLTRRRLRGCRCCAAASGRASRCVRRGGAGGRARVWGSPAARGPSSLRVAALSLRPPARAAKRQVKVVTPPPLGDVAAGRAAPAVARDWVGAADSVAADAAFVYICRRPF